jgi:predicted nuclease with TOPRIM domain
MDQLTSEWQRKGATLSDKTAWKEFGLTQDDIVRAIRAGRLQFREGAIYGNPFLRLLRREVEALVEHDHGDNHLRERKAKTELAQVNRQLKRLKAEVAALEERKSQLIADLGSGRHQPCRTRSDAR